MKTKNILLLVLILAIQDKAMGASELVLIETQDGEAYLGETEVESTTRHHWPEELDWDMDCHTLTDGNGPEVFTRCSTKWVRNSDLSKYDGEYKNIYGGLGCVLSEPPPSAENKICEKFHEKIKQLKENPKRKELNDDFVKAFLESNPTETVLIPTEEIRKITKSVNNNETYCFSTEPGPYGWCATCKRGAKKGESGYCPKERDGYIKNPEEVAWPNATEGWGFCQKLCKSEVWDPIRKLKKELPQSAGLFRDNPVTRESDIMEWRDCHTLTDGNGPEVFTRCSTSWIRNDDLGKDDWGEYRTTWGHHGCETSLPPPSSENKICEKFHDKIKQLKENPKRKELNDDFVKAFLESNLTEAVLIPTEEIRKITKSVNNNETYCFSTEPGPYGWCATCKRGAKKGESGYCPKESTGHIENPNEVAWPNATEGWGFCQKPCGH